MEGHGKFSNKYDGSRKKSKSEKNIRECSEVKIFAYESNPEIDEEIEQLKNYGRDNTIVSDC